MDKAGAMLTDISIHSPRMGRDGVLMRPVEPVHISIHSPRMGRDLPGRGARADRPYFNPLSPHGERQ